MCGVWLAIIQWVVSFARQKKAGSLIKEINPSPFRPLKEMNMVNKMRAIHPGEILKGELEELNLSANLFAKALGVPTNRITAILNEQRSITADTALRLARFFGSTPDFWMSLQSSYDVKVTWETAGNDIEKTVKPRELLEA
jgi:addiction module HigA family antidote